MNFEKEKRKALKLSFIAFFAVLFLGLLTIFNVPNVKAATTFTFDTVGLQNEMMDSAFLGQNSDPTPSIRMNLIADSGGVIFVSANIGFNGNGFSTSTLANLSTGTSSGVMIYDDSGDTMGMFDPNDSLVSLDATPAWIGTSSIVTFSLDASSTPTVINNGSNTYFYVVIRTSNTALNGVEIGAGINLNWVVTTATSGPSSQIHCRTIYN